MWLPLFSFLATCDVTITYSSIEERSLYEVSRISKKSHQMPRSAQIAKIEIYTTRHSFEATTNNQALPKRAKKNVDDVRLELKGG
jgi:hypothetical protein